MRRVIKTDRGFTLIEILIAIVLLSLLMISVYSILDNSIKTKDDVVAEDAERLSIETALNRFETDFRQIWSPLYYTLKEKKKSDEENIDEDGNQIFEASKKFPIMSNIGVPVPEIENEEKNTFVFMTASNWRKKVDAKQSNFAWVQYTLRNSTIEDNEKKQAPYELIRYYTANNVYTKEHEWDKIKPHVLLRNIKSLEFHFWDPTKKKFIEGLKNLGDKKYLLRGVKLLMTWVDYKGIEHEVERTYRPAWTYFDPRIDKKLSRGTTPGGETVSEEYEDEDFGDESFEDFDEKDEKNNGS